MDWSLFISIAVGVISTFTASYITQMRANDKNKFTIDEILKRLQKVEDTKTDNQITELKIKVENNKEKIEKVDDLHIEEYMTKFDSNLLTIEKRISVIEANKTEEVLVKLEYLYNSMEKEMKEMKDAIKDLNRKIQ